MSLYFLWQVLANIKKGTFNLIRAVITTNLRAPSVRQFNIRVVAL
jgi:hypothetical protein